MLRMEHRVYKQLCRELSQKSRSLREVAEKYSLDAETVFIIHSQLVVNHVKKNYYKFFDRKDEFLERWRAGETILQISCSVGFPPVLIASMILSAMGEPRGRVRQILRDPGCLENPRLAGEILQALRKDPIYSPQGVKTQEERGRRVEKLVADWLTKSKISFITQREAEKMNMVKTPDFIVKSDFEIMGEKIFWLESKASFGDPPEIRRGYIKQFKPYIEIFGPGMVIYWYGFVKNHRVEPVKWCNHLYIGSKTLIERGAWGETKPPK